METFRAEILLNSLSPFCPPPPPRLSTGRNALARTGEQADSRRRPKLMHNGWKNGLWRKKSRRDGGKFVENRWGQSGNRVGIRPAPPGPSPSGCPHPFPPVFHGLIHRRARGSRREAKQPAGGLRATTTCAKWPAMTEGEVCGLAYRIWSAD